jgi:methylated-DNA-protein-cysteine methyltransferase-like protein
MPHNSNPGLFQKVYSLVRKIPKGKVMTYGQIAKELGLKDVRKVGWALHALRQAQGKPYVPCHRVVNKEGEVAENFAFDGWVEQRRRLESEGVVFIGEKKVDLKKHLWQV